MATNNSVNTPLSGTTGTGNFVGSTSPTLTTPKIGQINDTNGNASLKFYPTPSAVNYLQIDNGVAGEGPAISCVGASAAMNLRLVPNNGAVQINSTDGGGYALRIDTGSPTLQHVTFLVFPLTSAIRLVTFPDADGNVVLSSSTTAQSGNVGAWVNLDGAAATPTIRASGNVTSITDNGAGDYTVNFTTAFADANYAIVGMCRFTSNGSITVGGQIGSTTWQAAGSARINVITTAGALVDALYTNIICVR